MKENMSILVVDDEDAMGKAVYRVINSVEADITVLSDSTAARDYIKTNSVDLLITDYMMPHFTGLDLIKTMSEFQSTGLSILVTGANDFNIAVSAVNQGSVHQFITKPYNRDYLLETVNDAMNIIKENREFNKFKTWSFSMIQDGQSDDVYEILQQNALDGLMTLMKAKDVELYEHSNRLAKLAEKLGHALNLPKELVKDIYEGALLHDIGKLAIKDIILNKPGKLEEAEYTQIKKHAEVGADLLEKLGMRGAIVEGVRQHHERYDGNGYPDGLKGDEICIQAKIICIVDVYDAMRSERAYKKGFTLEHTQTMMLELADKLFDGQVLDVFFDMIYSMN